MYGTRGSSLHGLSKARILECVAFPSPGYFPDLGITPVSPALQADSLPLSHPEPGGKKKIQEFVLLKYINYLTG